MNGDLEVLLRSRIPLIAVESHDESQVIKSLLRACANLSRETAPAPGAAPGRGGQPLFQWTVTDGLKRIDVDVGAPC